MPSLKGYTPIFASILGMSAAALYERQRALVREGLLNANEGRGPGSGVRATAPGIALLILSVLASDRLTESVERTRILAESELAGIPDNFEYAGLKTLLDFITYILTQKAASIRVSQITVSRTSDFAEITYSDDNGNTQFVEFRGPAWQEPAISISASMNRTPLQKLAEHVQAIMAEKSDEAEDV